ncbi:MAG: carboxypeptidase-like regulatory domain-containing protein [Bacteroidetes bacterium]|nr:carboxypeptidase-like regulatory domain-containing protein [Bacteroidota bacterium]
MRYSLFLLLAILLFITIDAIAQKQSRTTVYGKITDEQNRPLNMVSVQIKETGSISKEDGSYEISVPTGKQISIIYSLLGYIRQIRQVNPTEDQKIKLDIKLSILTNQLQTVIINERFPDKSFNFTRIDPKSAAVIPTVGGSVESLIKSQPGVSSNNELSAQYNVRGGNYDENLVYVNDIEIFKPFLIRSGQQEGLSFINSDLVSSIAFSAGGFEAKYGDKMSSVLDIHYRNPTEFAGTVMLSLLGASVHLEGASKNKKFTWITGLRQKSNQYLLNSMDTKGAYHPSFTDCQGLLTYTISPKLEVSLLGNYAKNTYRLVPEDRETSFGTLNEALRLKVYFEGEEADRFDNGTAALNLNWHPSQALNLKLTGSYFHSYERESFDIMGQYWIGLLETDLSKPNFGDVLETKGVGSYLDHSRNYLTADVFNIEQRGAITHRNNQFQWGIKAQHEQINDRLNEWTMIDSVGYSLPYPPQTPGEIPQNSDFKLSSAVKTEHNLASWRYIGFVQNTIYLRSDSVKIWLNTGLRSAYWDVNHEWLLSPRVILGYKPNWQNNITFRISSGLYQQPPFYRELRDLDGNLHLNTPAQQSIHLLTGADWIFKSWGRPFKLTAEAYYKFLNNLIPYEIDNVRIRYLSGEKAKGYATGIDFKINGEFVPGLESWASLSFMKTEEDIVGDYYYRYLNKQGETIVPGYTSDAVAVDSVKVNPGYIPRPTDQRVTFSLFFQDHLPNNPTVKVHLNLLYGSALPFGPPDSPKYLQTLRIPPYRRVDIGFSKQIIGEEATYKPKNRFRHIKSLWISAEVFNLFQISNTVSYLWISDVTNRKYAVPNYLTPRQLNLRLIAKF